MLVLIKNGFSVPSDYVPSDLRDVNIPYQSEVGQLRDEAATALENMYKDGLKQGYSIAIKSSYRSYDTQLAVYNEYFAMYDAAYAASLVSIPGSSEHQCGLSVDLTSQSVMDGTYGTFGETSDYNWVEELVPEMAQGKHSNLPTLSFLFGFCIMMILDVVLG